MFTHSTPQPSKSKFIKRAPAWGAALLFACVAAQAEPMRVAGNFPADHSSSVAIEQFKQEVEKVSKGELRIDTFPAMKLGSAKENVEQVGNGSIFMTWIPPAYLSSTVPELSALSIPFAFPSRQAAFKVVDGKVGKILTEKLAAKGLVLLGFMELGPRQLTNNKRPIRSINDFAGLKIRLQPDEIHMATFRALGAEPVAIDIKGLYAAMESGAVDGQENPFAVILGRDFYKVQKYISNTSHFFDFIMVLANKKAFDGLAPKNQKIIREAATKAVTAQRAQAASEDLGAVVKMASLGISPDPVKPSFRADLRRVTKSVVEKVREKAGSELVDEVLRADKSGH